MTPIKYTPMRHMPVRCTPMRRMPMKCIPMRCTTGEIKVPMGRRSAQIIKRFRRSQGSSKIPDNHSGPNSHLHSNPDELGHLPMIFVVVKFEMSTVAEPSSSRSGKLEPETVIDARVGLEDSAIERGT